MWVVILGLVLVGYYFAYNLFLLDYWGERLRIDGIN